MGQGRRDKKREGLQNEAEQIINMYVYEYSIVNFTYMCIYKATIKKNRNKTSKVEIAEQRKG